jgi:hypothetical protein
MPGRVEWDYKQRSSNEESAFGNAIGEVTAAVSWRMADVRIDITSWDDPEEWPFSERVWVITSLPKQDIQQHFGKRLHGDTMRVGWSDDAIEGVEVPIRMRPLGVWWD